MIQAFDVGFSMWSTNRKFDIYFIYSVENFEYKKILVVEADSSIFLLKWTFRSFGILILILPYSSELQI